MIIDVSVIITSTAQMCVFACGVTSDFEMFEEHVNLHSIQGQTKGLDFILALLYSLQKHNLELSKLGGIVTGGVPSVIGSKNGMVSLYKHMHEFGLQNELIQYHIIHQQSLIVKSLGLKQTMTDVINAVNFIRSHELNHRQYRMLLGEVESECDDII
jgi:hypothetical protein